MKKREHFPGKVDSTKVSGCHRTVNVDVEVTFNWIITFLRFWGGSEKITEIRAGSLSSASSPDSAPPDRFRFSLFAACACAPKCEPARRLRGCQNENGKLKTDNCK